MVESWLRACEQIAHTTVINKVRVLGFTSVHGLAGVTTLSRMVVEILQYSGLSSSLVDFTSPVREAAESPVREASDKNPAGSLIDTMWERTDQGKFPVLTARPSPRNKFLFSNKAVILEALDPELAKGRILVLDLPPVISERKYQINPIGPASVCDSLLLACPRGHITAPRLIEAVNTLRSARTNLSGIVLNDFDYVSPGEGIGRIARRVFILSPRLGQWIERKARTSALLN